MTGMERFLLDQATHGGNPCPPSDSWYCPDCDGPVALDRHGRCENCGSDSIESTHAAVKELVPKHGSDVANRQ